MGDTPLADSCLSWHTLVSDDFQELQPFRQMSEGFFLLNGFYLDGSIRNDGFLDAAAPIWPLD